jgi:hypothetical protein
MHGRTTYHRLRLLGGCALLAVAPLAAADVTTQQTTSLNLAGIVRMNGTATEALSGDKQRRDAELRCEGLMSLVCGKGKSAEIVRLDRDLEWTLQPDKKRYSERPFPTADERAAAKLRLQEAMQKLKDCPPTQPQGKGVDKSKCDMSPPKLEVKRSDETATLAGHLARKSSVTMTQSCRNKETGEVCEYDYGFDVWLTADELPGQAEQQAFGRAHLQKLGLDPGDDLMKGQVRQLMAQYADAFKQLSQKAGDLKGQPLRTRFYFAMGGEHCGQAKAAPAGGGGDTRGGLADVSSAIRGSLLGGLLAKKGGGDKPAAAGDAGAGNAAPGAPATLVEFSVETVAISAGAIPAERFEIPAGWVKEPPKPPSKEREFSCPASDAR